MGDASSPISDSQNGLISYFCISLLILSNKISIDLSKHWLTDQPHALGRGVKENESTCLKPCRGQTPRCNDLAGRNQTPVPAWEGEKEKYLHHKCQKFVISFLSDKFPRFFKFRLNLRNFHKFLNSNFKHERIFERKC